MCLLSITHSLFTPFFNTLTGVKILVASNPFVKRYFDELERLGVLAPGRLLPWGGKSVWRSYNHVYYANEMYVANEWPWCNDRNPHRGGTTTYYPKEMLAVCTATCSHVTPFRVAPYTSCNCSHVTPFRVAPERVHKSYDR
jgi:hypothetical protein